MKHSMLFILPLQDNIIFSTLNNSQNIDFDDDEDDFNIDDGDGTHF